MFKFMLKSMFKSIFKSMFKSILKPMYAVIVYSLIHSYSFIIDAVIPIDALLFVSVSLVIMYFLFPL